VSDLSAELARDMNFGPAAAVRYEALIDAAIGDVAENPLRLAGTECAAIG
jgi:hypothetical protein